MMARLRRNVNCCPRRLKLIFLFCFLMKVAGKEWTSTMPQTTVTYDVLHLSKPKLPKSSDQSFPQTVSDVAAVHNTSQSAKIIHRKNTWSGRRLNATRQELMHEMMRRDEARVSAIANRINRVRDDQRTASVETPVRSGLPLDSGEYLAVVGVGSPRRDMSVVVDTGSDITWLQCAPCSHCYKQHDALFDPATSQSYQVLHCDAAPCLNLDSMGCVSNNCAYQVNYADGSFSIGEFATENMVLDTATGTIEKVVINNIPFGCGHDNEGMFGMTSGLLGLGKGPLSFPNHMGDYGTVFSYCFPDREGDSNVRSTLIFGDAAVPDRNIVTFTPQLHSTRSATHYYVQITGISVGGNILSTIPVSAFNFDLLGNGGTILDSGTTITRLQTMAYRAVRDAFRNSTQHLKFVGGFQFFDTCYDLMGIDSVDVPTMTFHFQGDYNMLLPPSNYIIPVTSNGTYCLAFTSIVDFSIIGNIQQQGFRVIYDNDHMQIGFSPNQC